MSEELIHIFAECTEAIEQGRLTVDECLAQYPQYRAELTDLLLVAMQARAVPTAYPPSDFRQQARARLLAQLPPRPLAANGAVTSQTVAGSTAVHQILPQSLQTAWQALTQQWSLPLRPSLVAGAALLLVCILFVGVWLRSSGSAEEAPAALPEIAQNDPTVPPTAASPARAGTGETESVPPTNQSAPAAVAENESEARAAADAFTTFVPLVSSPLQLHAQTAAVEAVVGLVEVQGADGQWAAVNRMGAITAGERVRTGKLSQATLTFYDGSQAHLGADTEISIDELNALRSEEGFRTVVMTQWVGDSEHSVQFRNDGGSRYEVKTPTGSGTARGTRFQVLVTPDLLSRYLVTEGRVDVSGSGRTVSVTAGQLTTLTMGSVPVDPVFNISGEGEVTAIGATWTIAGQTFQTHAHTIIAGNPQVGDLVRVDGHLLPDGGRMADRIVLIRRAVANRFSLSGEVGAIGEVWTVAGQTIVVNDGTVIDEGIAVGDRVRVEGIILPGGTLQAQVITRLDDAPGLPFQFVGLVQSMGEGGWTISGQVIALDEQTAVDDDIAVGDLVAVRGWILDDGTWLARTIRRQADDLPTFAFTGVVQSMDPWQVAGIGFETRSWTVIAPGIAVGDRVWVRGSILSDGTWVAESITPLTTTQPNTVVFVGAVVSINPWVVSGVPLFVTGNTVIAGNIAVGTLVIVETQVLPNGTWTVLSIRPLYPNFGFGCLILSSPVIAVNANSFQVRHWNGNIDRAQVQGNIQVNHVVTLPLCTGWNGTIIITGTIVVIYQPVVVIINNGGVPPSVPPGCRITGIGNNNPRLKCSDRGSGRGSGSSRRS